LKPHFLYSNCDMGSSSKDVIKIREPTMKVKRRPKTLNDAYAVLLIFYCLG
jgi:hypothetical protein